MGSVYAGFNVFGFTLKMFAWDFSICGGNVDADKDLLDCSVGLWLFTTDILKRFLKSVSQSYL